MKRPAILVCLALASCMLLAACAQQPAEEETFSEGVDTPCTVEYRPYAGEHASLFLEPGDTIAVISPSALPSQEQVDAVVAGLTEWGYVPVTGAHVVAEERTLDDCLADLTWALEDPSVKAIFCVRGGYGVSQVMDQLPLETIASSQKLIIGYSDISVLHAGWTMAGVPSIHACMSGTFSDLPAECVEAEQRILQGEIPAYTCEAESTHIGGAEGTLIGGNLSTFTSVLGTVFDSTKVEGPYILFLEDVGEDVQHIHRYLTVLDHVGALDNASGIIFGEWTDVPLDMDDFDGSSRGGEFASVTDMIEREILPDYDGPVAFGFPAGHGDVNYPLLMGETAHLNVTGSNFSLAWE